MIITEILRRNARVYGKKTALIEREPAINLRREISWEAFDRQADSVANALIARGIRKGDKVVQLMTNCLEFLPVYFGILVITSYSIHYTKLYESPKIMALASAMRVHREMAGARNRKLSGTAHAPVRRMPK